MQRDKFAYFLSVDQLSAEDAQKLTNLLAKEEYFAGALSPDFSIDNFPGKDLTFYLEENGVIDEIDRDEIDLAMHALAQMFPEASFTLTAENTDNKLEQFKIRVQGDTYQHADLQSFMPPLSDPVPFEQRYSKQPSRDFEGEFFCNTDFDLLYQQKLALLKALETMGPISQTGRVPEDVLEGLVNFLDFIGDWAEKEGRFTYPEVQDIDAIMTIVKAQLNKTGEVIYALPDDRFSIRIAIEEGADTCMNPGKEFYWVQLRESMNGTFEARFSGGADYNDFDTVRELCEEAIAHCERLVKHRKAPLSQQISKASGKAATPEIPGQKTNHERT